VTPRRTRSKPAGLPAQPHRAQTARADLGTSAQQLCSAEKRSSRRRARGVPFHTGAVVVGTWERHAREIFDWCASTMATDRVVFNRAAVMVLPTGVNKATGLRRALAELGRSEHNLIAFGDAENDVPPFNLAEFAVGARGRAHSDLRRRLRPPLSRARRRGAHRGFSPMGDARTIRPRPAPGARAGPVASNLE
jgi:hypothetical protein